MSELKCPQCSKTYKTQRGLDNHVATKHVQAVRGPKPSRSSERKAPPGGGYS